MALIENAWSKHPQLILAASQESQFEMREEQYKANRIPSLFFQGSQNMNAGRSIDPFTYQFTNNTIWSNQFSLNSSVTLFNGFQNNRNISWYHSQSEAQSLQIEKLKNDMALSIANQYLQVLLVREQTVALDSQMAQTQRNLIREQKLLSNGRSSELKVKQIKSQLMEEKAQAASLKGNEQSALIQLKNMSYVDQSAFDIEPISTTTLPSTDGNDASGIYAFAEKEQASMKYQEAKEKAQMDYVNINKGSRLPSLVLNAALSTGYSSQRKRTDIIYSYLDAPIGYLLSDPNEIVYGTLSTPTYSQNPYSFGDQLKDNFSQFVGLTLRVPIFQQKMNSTNIAIAEIQLENAKQETALEKSNLKRDIELALAQFETARVNESNGREIHDLQLEIYKDMEKMYVQGSISLFEVLSQKTRFFNAESALIRYRYELIFRTLVLDYYKGKPIKL